MSLILSLEGGIDIFKMYTKKFNQILFLIGLLPSEMRYEGLILFCRREDQFID